MTDQAAPRGTPPSQKQLAKQLGARLALWDSVVEMVQTFGATWKWAHSEVTGAWSYRAYLPGQRFFVSLSLVEGGFELSLNLKAEEWDHIATPDPQEQAFIEALRAKALATGDDPAWLHIPVESEALLAPLAKLLIARARRVQPPRGKKRR